MPSYPRATRSRLTRELGGDRVSFESEIRPLFRTDDADAMSWAFDLTSYEDVREQAESIYDRLADGSMPCDDPWPTERVQRFRDWIDAGTPP
jgi:hypothetical protein